MLTLLLVILWLSVSAAAIVGVVNGNLLELNHGWSGQYYEHNAETEKNAQQQEQQQQNDHAGREADGRSKERHQD